MLSSQEEFFVQFSISCWMPSFNLMVAAEKGRVLQRDPMFKTVPRLLFKELRQLPANDDISDGELKKKIADAIDLYLPETVELLRITFHEDVTRIIQNQAAMARREKELNTPKLVKPQDMLKRVKPAEKKEKIKRGKSAIKKQSPVVEMRVFKERKRAQPCASDNESLSIAERVKRIRLDN
ncbi:DEK_C domain-containing protein [Caenorhabditis elegans]|uniref:DEK_C domain-containing protein n=1 Tax=Caenorhabditis elegans TaxID=6239 RepID=Q9N4D0_CAEEL|nr:DEK_C domain-containing protein [Caenorhabditis elegans]CCD68966.1 DEK_C domain-containing protein [Caenorhabditis elegans]|eukprot:NP_508321.1 Uncharacterized protein CELE_Y75D11A.3 [Caenorhabditis elegans]